MTQQKVSIILPFYNSVKTIEKAILSCLNQTYFNFELILINDGSTDSSDLIAAKFKVKDNRVIYFSTKNNGVSAARNLGIENSSGYYIKFLDSDDWLDVNALKIMVNEIQLHSCDLVITGMNIFRNEKLIRSPNTGDGLVKINNNFDSFLRLQPIFSSPCNKLFKKEKISKTFDQKYKRGEDLKFNIDYFTNIKSYYLISKALYNVSLDNSSSLNRSFDEKAIIGYIEIYNYMEAAILKKYSSINNTVINNYVNFEIIKAIHFHLWRITKLFNFSNFKQMFNNFVKIVKIDGKLKQNSKLRLDYLIFKSFYLNRSHFLLFLYFKLKTLLLK